MNHRQRLFRRFYGYWFGSASGMVVLVVDSLYFVDQQPMNSILAVIGMALLFGFGLMIGCGLWCPNCSQSLGRTIHANWGAHWNGRKTIRYCPFCNYDLELPEHDIAEEAKNWKEDAGFRPSAGDKRHG